MEAVHLFPTLPLLTCPIPFEINDWLHTHIYGHSLYFIVNPLGLKEIKLDDPTRPSVFPPLSSLIVDSCRPLAKICRPMSSKESQWKCKSLVPARLKASKLLSAKKMWQAFKRIFADQALLPWCFLRSALWFVWRCEKKFFLSSCCLVAPCLYVLLHIVSSLCFAAIFFILFILPSGRSLTYSECTPYEKGVFHLKLTLSSDFPASPPRGYFLTKIFHPNVSKAGEICVDTLKKDWKPEFGISHILLVVRCLLIHPNPESALNEDAGKQLLERLLLNFAVIHVLPLYFECFICPIVLGSLGLCVPSRLVCAFAIA